LREFYEAAGGNAPERKPHVADFAPPNGFAEPDPEFIHDEASPAGGQEVAKLMDYDEKVEDEDDLNSDEESMEDLGQHGRWSSRLAKVLAGSKGDGGRF
jgi:hypothetical protein